MSAEVQALLESQRAAIAGHCLRFGVRRLSLFGSALTPRWDPRTSDIDFIAEFGSLPDGIDLFAQQFVFQAELESLLGRSVDVIDAHAIRDAGFKEAATRAAQDWYAA